MEPGGPRAVQTGFTRAVHALPLLAHLGALAIAILALGRVLRHWGIVRAAVGWNAYLLAVLLFASSLLGIADLRVRLTSGVPWRALRWLFCLLVVGALGHVVLMPNGQPALLAVSLGVIGGAFVFLVAGGGGLARRLPARLLRVSDVTSANLCAILVGTEILLHVLSWVRPSPLFAGAYDPLHTIEVNRPMGGFYYYGFPLSSRGYYDDEPSGQGRLCVSIADSFSLGVVPHEDHFTTVCEREIQGLTVYNTGVPGIGPSEYVELVREGMALHPDAIVVDLFVGNDLVEACPHAGPGHWFGRQNLLVYLVPPRVVRLLKEYRREGMHAPGGFRGAMRVQHPLSRPEIEKLYPWVSDPMRETPGFSPEGYEEIEARRAVEAFGPGPRCMAETLADIDKMKSIAGSTPLLVMIIPDEMQVEDALWETVSRRLPGMALDRTLPQRELGRELAARHIPVLDLLTVLRAVTPLPDGRRHVYFLRDTHWNGRGNEVAGKELAKALRETFRGRVGSTR